MNVNDLGNVSGNVTLNFNTNNNYVMTLTGTTQFLSPTGIATGQSGVIVLKQDGTGSRTKPGIRRSNSKVGQPPHSQQVLVSQMQILLSRTTIHNCRYIYRYWISMNPFVQSLLLSDQTTGSDDTGFTIDQSVRFKGTNRLTRTFASITVVGTYTWSAWIKISDFGTGDHQIFGTVSPLQFHHIRKQ